MISVEANEAAMQRAGVCVVDMYIYDGGFLLYCIDIDT